MSQKFLVKMETKKLKGSQKAKVIGLILVSIFIVFVGILFKDELIDMLLTLSTVFLLIFFILRESKRLVDVILNVEEKDNTLFLNFSSNSKELNFNETIKFNLIKTLNINNGLVKIEYLNAPKDSSVKTLSFIIVGEANNYWENLQQKVNANNNNKNII